MEQVNNRVHTMEGWARESSAPHEHSEDMLRNVQLAPEGIVWDVSRQEFEELLATKRESDPSPDRLPYSMYRCAGGTGTRFLLEAYQYLFRGGLFSFANPRMLTRLHN